MFCVYVNMYVCAVPLLQYCRPDACPFQDGAKSNSGTSSGASSSGDSSSSSSNNNTTEKDVSQIRGCKVVSVCMETDVIEQYKKALSKKN